MADAFVELIQAAAPIGESILKSIRGVAQAIADLGEEHPRLLSIALGAVGITIAFLNMLGPVVAIAAVHWPAAWGSFGELMQGYVFTDNGHGNFKLPVLFIGMLMPLLLLGPGKLSVDAWVRRRCGQSAETSPTRECHDRQQLHRGSA